MYSCVPHVSGAHEGQKKELRSPRTGVTDSCVLPCGFWELTLGQPKKIQVYKMPVDRSLRVFLMAVPPKMTQSESWSASLQGQQADAVVGVKGQRGGTANYRRFPDTGVNTGERQTEEPV